MKTPMEFTGRWRISETELWAQDALDMIAPAHLTFDANGLGHFQMIAVEGGIDSRFTQNRVEFSWSGTDDGDPASGRGWAAQNGEVLTGRVYFHRGDDSSFVAHRERRSVAAVSRLRR
jgi:hypothetical protein